MCTGQGAADAAAPLVVHACSSTTNPTSLRDWWVLGYEYWSAKPSPVRLTLTGYPDPDRRRAWLTSCGAGWLTRIPYPGWSWCCVRCCHSCLDLLRRSVLQKRNALQLTAA